MGIYLFLVLKVYVNNFLHYSKSHCLDFLGAVSAQIKYYDKIYTGRACSHVRKAKPIHAYI